MTFLTKHNLSLSRKSKTKIEVTCMRETSSWPQSGSLSPETTVKTHMDYAKNNIGNLVTLCLLFAGVLYLCFWSASISQPFFLFQNHQCPKSTSTAIDVPKDELEAALNSASMANRTVIIAVVNKAYADRSDGRSMFDVFLESFWLGDDTRFLLDHLLVVAVDQTAYDRCKFRRLHCYRLVTDGVDFGGEKVYMSDDFIKMMWRRTLFLSQVLKHGYNFIFTDADVMWLRNPFAKLSSNETEDLQISTDKFNGDPRSEANLINTGFYYIRSNNRTIALFDTWYGLKDNSTGKKEQDVLASLIQEAGVFRQLGLRVTFLDTLYFSGFCQNSKDFRAVTTVHANCCQKISAKVADLTTVLRDWQRFKRTIAMEDRFRRANKTMSFQWSKHNACINSWIVGSKTLG